jgi:flotillin
MSADIPGKAKIDVTSRPRQAAGWRAGRPAEDPDKVKRWGYVAAKPSEYLVHMRSGRVRPSSSGQGTTCFKWPTDSVAIIPTSLQRIGFEADQVTREKVGVFVRGVAVYRIVDPLLAFRVLNWSFPERAQEKLEETLGAMLTGATRRLVANLTVDECLTRRKQAIASELIVEMQPVLAGEGALHDGTDRGWGIVLDTVEIQEVRVTSENVFQMMQAPFRAALERDAARARAEMELLRVSADQEIAKARMDAERALFDEKMTKEREEKDARTAERIRDEERRLKEADALLAAQEKRKAMIASERELAELTLESELASRRARLIIVREEGVVAHEIATGKAEVARVQAEADARRIMAEKMPELAHAMGQKIGEMRVVSIGGDTPFKGLTETIAGVVELVRKG